MSLVSPHPGGARFKHAFYTAGQQCTRRESGDVKWKYKINSFVDLTKKIEGGLVTKQIFYFFKLLFVLGDQLDECSIELDKG